MGAFSATDKSSLVSLDLYTGAGTPKSFVGLAARGEELPAGGGDSWSGAVLSGRTAWYLGHRSAARSKRAIEFAGGWRERQPLQLSLGDRRADSAATTARRFAGGRRSVLRLEQRQLAFATKRYVQWGTAIFTDIGQHVVGRRAVRRDDDARDASAWGCWPPCRRSRGECCAPTLPFRSPAARPKGCVLRVFAVDATRFFWRDPSDLSPVRAGAPASPIFGWP